jgi:preprotein translocase subunit SecD
MSRCASFLLVLLGSTAAVWSQDRAPASGKKLPNGVYAVQRDSLKEKDVLPLKDGEVLVFDRHRYLKNNESERPQFVVVHSLPDVKLELAGEPKAVKEDGEVMRILLKLQPKAAAELERLTRDQVGRQVAIVLGGEVVTMHKVRAVIKGGDVQITSCVPGAAGHLLIQLQNEQKTK